MFEIPKSAKEKPSPLRDDFSFLRGRLRVGLLRFVLGAVMIAIAPNWGFAQTPETQEVPAKESSATENDLAQKVEKIKQQFKEILPELIRNMSQDMEGNKGLIDICHQLLELPDELLSKIVELSLTSKGENRFEKIVKARPIAERIRREIEKKGSDDEIPALEELVPLILTADRIIQGFNE